MEVKVPELERAVEFLASHRSHESVWFKLVGGLEAWPTT